MPLLDKLTSGANITPIGVSKTEVSVSLNGIESWKRWKHGGSTGGQTRRNRHMLNQVIKALESALEEAREELLSLE